MQGCPHQTTAKLQRAQGRDMRLRGKDYDCSSYQDFRQAPYGPSKGLWFIYRVGIAIPYDLWPGFCVSFVLATPAAPLVPVLSPVCLDLVDFMPESQNLSKKLFKSAALKPAAKNNSRHLPQQQDRCLP